MIPLEVNLIPFLKNRNASVAGLIIKNRAPNTPDPEENQEDTSTGIEYCAQDLIEAVHNKDVLAVSQALKDAFQILESQPHEEDQSIEPHSYEAQNIKAGEQE